MKSRSRDHAASEVVGVVRPSPALVTWPFMRCVHGIDPMGDAKASAGFDQGLPYSPRRWARRFRSKIAREADPHDLAKRRRTDVAQPICGAASSRRAVDDSARTRRLCGPARANAAHCSVTFTM